MTLDKASFKNITLFLAVNALCFAIHQVWFINTEEQSLIDLPLSYGVNAVFSLLVCIMAFFSHQVFKGQTGFVYLGLSVVKMILLYAILYPQNNIESLEKIDKLVLLIPFGVNLVLEQIYVVKLLKLLDLPNS